MKIIFTKEDLVIMAKAFVLVNKMAKLEGVINTDKEDKVVDLCNLYLDNYNTNGFNDIDIVVTNY